MNRKWLTGRIILRVICTATNMDPSTSMIGDPMPKICKPRAIGLR